MDDFESYLDFDAPSAPARAKPPTALSRSVASPSQQVFFRTSPYTGSTRGRSNSDGLLAVSRTQQHRTHPINSTFYMLAPATHSSQSSGSPELTSSTARIDVDTCSQSQSTTLSDSDFDSSTFDFAMAFAEASYSEDTPSPVLQAKLRPATQPSNSPSEICDPSPPDLYALLNVTPLTPPASDKARRQSLRFEADLYTRKLPFGFITSCPRLLVK